MNRELFKHIFGMICNRALFWLVSGMIYSIGFIMMYHISDLDKIGMSLSKIGLSTGIVFWY